MRVIFDVDYTPYVELGMYEGVELKHYIGSLTQLVE